MREQVGDGRRARMYAGWMRSSLVHVLCLSVAGLTLAAGVAAGPQQRMMRPNVGAPTHGDDSREHAAAPAGDRDHDHVQDAAAPSASASAVAAPIVSDGGAPDAGGLDETPEQRGRRRAYVDATTAKIRKIVHGGGKSVTEEEREVIRKHWRHTMRLWRIRNLAEADGDASITQRVDLLISKSEKHLEAKLGELAEKAPRAEGHK